MIPDKYKNKVIKGKSHWLERKSDVVRFIKVLGEMKSEIDGLKVLDAGCAQGRDTKEISNNGIEVTGIDVDEKFIQEARRSYSRIRFDVGAIEKLPYEDEQFDAVYCVNTLFYTKPEESLPELERVLKLGGIVFVTLDEKIIDLEKNKEIHSQDIDETIKQFKNCDVLSRDYRERKDSSPFRHKHFFYDFVLRKEQSFN